MNRRGCKKLDFFNLTNSAAIIDEVKFESQVFDFSLKMCGGNFRAAVPMERRLLQIIRYLGTNAAFDIPVLRYCGFWYSDFLTTSSIQNMKNRSTKIRKAQNIENRIIESRLKIQKTGA